MSLVQITEKFSLTPEGSLEFPRARPVLLVFYPGDFTPTCTKQLCSYRDQFSSLRALGCDLIGVSANEAESQRKMLAAHNLPFPLLSDPEAKLIKPLGMRALGCIPKRGYALVDRQGQVRWRQSDLLPIFYTGPEQLVKTLKPLLELLK